MEHRLLASFVVLAEELHFGRAARRLHISQPPLSIQIKKLEEELGVALLLRNNRQVSLTEAGKALLVRARHLLAEADRARNEVRRIGLGDAGVLSIGYTPTATYEVLPRILPAFRRACPDVAIELRELSSPAQVSALHDERIEIGVACLPVDARGLVEHTLVHERPVTLLPASHPLSRRKSVPVQLLSGEPFILVDPEVEPGWAHACQDALRDARVDVRVVQHTDTKIALLGLVAAGMGLSVASSSLAVLGRDGVVFRPLTGLALRFRLGALLHPEPSPRAEHFWRLLKQGTRRSRPSAS